MAMILTMFLMGILLGFIGAGGSGFIIAILTVLYGVPIHTALGTSLAAMVFTTLRDLQPLPPGKYRYENGAHRRRFWCHYRFYRLQDSGMDSGSIIALADSRNVVFIGGHAYDPAIYYKQAAELR